MNWQPQTLPKLSVPIAPMIDCVFLLLIYFMATSTLKPQELSLPFTLPAIVETHQSIVMPEEQVIEVTASGNILINGAVYGQPHQDYYADLISFLKQWVRLSLSANNSLQVTIAPSPNTPQKIIIKIMDACAVAKIPYIHFATEETSF